MTSYRIKNNLYSGRVLIILMVFFFFFIDLSGQDLILRLNVLNNNSVRNTFKADTLVVPEVIRTNHNYNFDLTYLHAYDSTKHWFVKLGYNEINRVISVNDVFTFNGETQKRVTNSSYQLQEYNVSFGIQKSIQIGQNFSLSFGPEIIYKRYFRNIRTLERDYYNGYNLFLGSDNKKTIYAKTNIIGVGIRSGFYYSINDKFGIGIEENVSLLLTHINGTTFVQRELYDASSLESYVVDDSYNNVENTIRLQDYLSIGVKYSIK